MRDRLIELLKGAEAKVTEMISTPLALEEWLGIYADYLLANGVIVQPCKVGDKVYWHNKKSNKICCSVVEDIQIFFSKDTEDGNPIIFIYNYPDDMGIRQLGDDVFFTKEEAEQALVNYKSSKNDVEGKEDKGNEIRNNKSK